MPGKGWKKNPETGQYEAPAPLGAIDDTVIEAAMHGVVKTVPVDSLPNKAAFENVGLSNNEVLADPAYNTRPGMVPMYKDGQARYIAGQNIRLLYLAGWTSSCKICGGHHVNEDRLLDTSPNACPSIESVPWTECPYPSCTKKFYAVQEGKGERIDEDGYIHITAPGQSPTDMLKHKQALHVWHRHATFAASQRWPKPEEMEERVAQPA